MIIMANSDTALCPWCPTPTPVRAGGYFCEEHQLEAKVRARRDREAEAERNRSEWLSLIGVPRPLHAFSFATLDDTRCVAIVREYRQSVFDGRALVLLGPTGIGKTVASVALLNSLLPDFQMRMTYALGLALVRELQNFRACDEVIDRCMRARVLVVDDLPRHGEDERVAAMIEELLIVREAEQRATVITSNIAPKNLETLLSDRVRDRLKSWGRVEAVSGASLRRPPVEEAS